MLQTHDKELNHKLANIVSWCHNPPNFSLYPLNDCANIRNALSSGTEVKKKFFVIRQWQTLNNAQKNKFLLYINLNKANKNVHCNTNNRKYIDKCNNAKTMAESSILFYLHFLKIWQLQDCHFIGKNDDKKVQNEMTILCRFSVIEEGEKNVTFRHISYFEKDEHHKNFEHSNKQKDHKNFNQKKKKEKKNCRFCLIQNKQKSIINKIEDTFFAVLIE
ncbi:hypothetical protein RFI_27336 [Reticulomyxa filosa]|uniref:Uncharacterized protein n=1 Tax=Reticulomyxa filosa TaxID=46433 RepID=X6MAH9_RETFI|nr:hypothetical protein RFI_27336 [Reticulomyxa filosa]|eukprot:ETO10040.1 hypothetical protein RFI_27336 [Reticulomyxa filosa]